MCDQPSSPSHAEPSRVSSSSSSLPDEVWFLILDSLDYEGLHRASRLCKRDKRFDNALFRTKPPKTLPANTEVDIHPLLQSTLCIFTGKDAHTWADLGRDDFTRRAFDYPAVDEYATNPACGILNLDVRTGKDVAVTDRNGIKVRRVLQRLEHYWGAKPTSWIAQEIAVEQRVDVDKVTWQMVLGDHCGWTRWRDATVENEGKAVKMRAAPYDS
ncbi:hypothetical protein JCM10450v2_005938 [Rhodotorula kratochvilovae]